MKIKKLDSEKLILPFLFLVIIGPVLLFSPPSLYGDDYHFLETIKQVGAFDGVLHWIKEYGYSYRPISIMFLYFVYFISFGSTVVLYGLNILVYLFFIWVINYELKKHIINENQTPLATTIFFSLFLLNPTAFYQISSLTMVLGGALSVLLLGYYTRHYKKLTFKSYLIVSFLWLLSLLNYEQVIGLLPVAILLIIQYSDSPNFLSKLKRTIRPNLFLVIPTIIFLSLYFFSKSNPKVVSLEKLNQDKIETSTSENIESSSPVQLNYVESKLPPKSGRIESLKRKIRKVSYYFYQNFSYLFEMVQSNRKVIVLFFLISLSLFIYGIKISFFTHRRHYIFLIALGSIWFLSTMSPFLLYKNLHIPPYVTLIPSIGLGLIFSGLLGLLKSQFLTKTIFITYIGVSSIQQYSYFFGLKEEFSFWSRTHHFVENSNALDSDDSLIIRGIPEKRNQHFFWLEQATGIRYFKSLLGQEASELSVHRIPDQQALLISRDNAPSIRETTFKE